MRRSYVLSQWYLRLRWKWFTRLSAQSCTRVGKNFLAKGPCLIRSEGSLILGDDVLLDSSSGRSIELRVGRDAVLTIGNDVYINHGAALTCNINMSIGDHCLIGPDVMIMDDDEHPVDWKIRHTYWPSGPETRLGAPIHIEQYAWLCARSIVLKGVTIGEGSVVAAGAVVTRSVPPHTIVAGVPAKVIKNLDE